MKKIYSSFLTTLVAITLLTVNCFSEENNRLYVNINNYSNPDVILPQPPAVDSIEHKVELQTIKNSMAQLTEEQKTLAAKDAQNLSVSFYADVLPGFEIEKLPVTKTLFESVKFNENMMKNIAKDYYKRPRPYQEDPSIKVCVPPVKDDYSRSYPSGHTAFAYSTGIVLAHLMPDKAKVIMDRAKLYGNNRIYCGAHWPSDVSSGQAIGSLVAQELLTNTHFKDLLDKSKAELTQAGLIKAAK